MTCFHNSGHLLDVLVGNSVMEQVTHRVHEDHFRRRPSEWLSEFFRYDAEVEALLVRMSGHSTEAFGKRLGVAVKTARTDLRATPHRVPGRVGPFDGGVLRRWVHPRFRYFLKIAV